jgi:hypothetical protein
VDRIDYGLAIAAQGDSDLGRVFATDTGQQALVTVQDEGLLGAQAGLQLLALLLGEFTGEERWLHTTGVSHCRLPRLRLH